jgi:hypothetical protein
MQAKLQIGWWKFLIVFMIHTGSLAIKKMTIEIMFDLIPLIWSKGEKCINEIGLICSFFNF